MKVKFEFVLLLSIFCYSSASKANNLLQDDYDEYNEGIYKKYVKMDKQLKSLVEKGVKSLLPSLLEAQEHINISSKCSGNLFDLLNGFRKLTNWSFTFLDASGKLQSGVQVGNLHMFGEYEECVNAIAIKKKKIEYQGQYCQILAKLFLPKVKKIPDAFQRLEGLADATKNSTDFMKLIVSRAHMFYAMGINIGVCVPSGCTKEDISNVLNYTVGEYVDAKIVRCLKKGDIFFWTKTRMIVVGFFVFLGLLTIICTLIDHYSEYSENKNRGTPFKILQCFSLKKNFPKLMNTEVSEGAITCFYGIRTLSLFWVILGHQYFVHAAALRSTHLLKVEDILKQFFSQIVLNGFLAVDAFFFMSGFVNSYTRISLKQKGKSQPGILKVILHRLWRIYPGLIIVFLMNELLNNQQHIMHDLEEKLRSNCVYYWWRNFIFIQNFYEPSESCLAQTWYISADMQLFLLSLFTIPVLLRKPKRGVILHISVILVVNLCSMSFWFMDEDLSPQTLDAKNLSRIKTLRRYTLYGLPVLHLGPYFIGILLGYIISFERKVNISKVAQLWGWLIASLFYLSPLFLTLRWNSGNPYTLAESVLYGAFSKTIMILGLSWLVYCCITGNARLINYILSLKLWIPLSRITYMVYLISPLIQAHHLTHSSFPMDFSDIDIIWTYFGNLSISFLMGFALVLIAESPFIAIENVLFGRDHGGKKTSTDLGNEMKSKNEKENGLNGIENLAVIRL